MKIFLAWLSLFLIGLLYCSSCECSSSYSVIVYEEIEWNQLDLCKSVSDNLFSRDVYFNRADQDFIKIWRPDYPLASHFLRALKLGFYQKIAPLKAIVFDKEGCCRGYATYTCQSAGSTLLVEENQYGYLRLKDVHFQNVYFKFFFQGLVEKNKETGLTYLDFVPSNIAMDQNQYVLLDLEGVYLQEELAEWNQINPFAFRFILDTLPIEYSQFIKTRLLSLDPFY